MIHLGNLNNEQGRYQEAVPLFQEAAILYEKGLAPGHWAVANVKSNYGICLTKLGRYAEAEAELLEAHEGLQAALGAEHDRTQKAAAGLVELYEAWNEPEKANAFR